MREGRLGYNSYEQWQIWLIVDQTYGLIRDFTAENAWKF